MGMSGPATADLDRLRAVVARRTGLLLDEHFQAAVDELLGRAGLATADDLARVLSGPGGRLAWAALIPRLTVSETHFWRDAAQFEALEEHVLPDLVRSAACRRRLRVWSAGCATGEEPYSVAMMLLRRPALAGWELDVVGSDVDREALAGARAGLYGPWSFREVPPGIRERFFTAGSGERLQVIEPVRRIVRFAEANLAERGMPGEWDLVLCRNVLIHMDPAAAAAVADRLAAALRPGAWLALGHADSSAAAFPGLEAGGPQLYRRTPGAAA